VSPIPQREALQPERTALAWQRTAVTAVLALVPVSLVALRTDRPVQAACGALAMVMSVGLVVSVRRRFAELRDDARGYSPFRPMVEVALVTLLAAAGGVVLGVTWWLD